MAKMAKMAILSKMAKMAILVKMTKIDQNTSENFEDRTLHFQTPHARSKTTQNDEIRDFPPKLIKMSNSHLEFIQTCSKRVDG